MVVRGHGRAVRSRARKIAGWGLALAIGAAAGPAARAQEREPDPPFQGIAGRLGVTQTLDHGQGRTVPLFACVYLDPDVSGWRLDARYITTSLDVEVRTPPVGGPWAGVGVDAEIRSADKSLYRYVDGDYLRRRVHYTTVAGGALLAGLESTGAGGRREAVLRWRPRRYVFEDAPDTHAGFRLPPDLTAHEVALDLVQERVATYREFEILVGESTTVSAGYVYRDRWRRWGDDPTTLGDVRKYQEFTWLTARLGIYRRLFGDHNLRLEVAAGIGDDLDRLSGFYVGSIFGPFPITGHYYAEWKADRVLLLNASYAADLPFLDLRLHVYCDTGLVRPLGERTHARTGLGLGLRLRIPVDAKHRLPVLLRYGWAPRAHRGASRGGHEAAVLVSFAL